LHDISVILKYAGWKRIFVLFQLITSGKLLTGPIKIKGALLEGITPAFTGNEERNLPRTELIPVRGFARQESTSNLDFFL